MIRPIRYIISARLSTDRYLLQSKKYTSTLTKFAIMPDKRKREADPANIRPSKKPNNSNNKPTSKYSKGFKVGPANLPEGAHKRKTQEIKRSLIERANIKKEYARVKKLQKDPVQDRKEKRDAALPVPASVRLDEEREARRRKMMEGQEAGSDESEDEGSANGGEGGDKDEIWGGVEDEAKTEKQEKQEDNPEEPAPSAVLEAPRPAASQDTPFEEDVNPDDANIHPDRRRQRRPKNLPFAREASAAQKRKQEAEERRRQREEAEAQRQQKIEDRERFRRAMAKARGNGHGGKRKLGRESQPLLERVRRMVGEHK